MLLDCLTPEINQRVEETLHTLDWTKVKENHFYVIIVSMKKLRRERDRKEREKLKKKKSLVGILWIILIVKSQDNY